MAEYEEIKVRADKIQRGDKLLGHLVTGANRNLGGSLKVAGGDGNAVYVEFTGGDYVWLYPSDYYDVLRPKPTEPIGTVRVFPKAGVPEHAYLKVAENQWRHTERYANETLDDDLVVDITTVVFTPAPDVV